MDNTSAYVSEQMGGLSYLNFLKGLLVKVRMCFLACTTTATCLWRGAALGANVTSSFDDYGNKCLTFGAMGFG